MQELRQTSENDATSAMTDSEAQDVLRLHLKRSEGSPQLSTAEVAEAIRIPESEVRSLLEEVRQIKRAEELLKPAPTVVKRKLRDSRLAIAAASIFVLMGIVFLTWFLSGWALGQKHEVREVEKFTNPVAQTENAAPTSVVQSGYSVTLGADTTFIPSTLGPVTADNDPDLLKVISTDLNSRFPPGNGYPIKQDENLLKALRAGNWNYQFLDQEVLKIGYPFDDLEASTQVPVYSGSQQEIKKLVQVERSRRMKGLLDLLAAKSRLKHGRTHDAQPSGNTATN
jgi:hypothetical protein